MTQVKLWSSKEIADAIGASLTAKFYASGVEIDSRDIQKGDVFIALGGAKTDGHRYVAQAFEQGAVAAIVSRVPEGCADKQERMFVVPDTYLALVALAKAARQRFQGKVIAITGSAGKTSTKNALKQVLSYSGITHASVKSYNNHVGLPLSVARTPKNADFAVFEMGMSAANEIRPLTKIARPHVALITSIGAAHYQSFGSIVDIARAKCEIFEGLEPQGTAIFSADSPFCDFMTQAAKKQGVISVIKTSLEDQSAHIFAEKFTINEHCSALRANILGEILTTKILGSGKHWVDNALNILATVSTVGGDIALAGIGLGQFQPSEGRGVKHTITIDGDRSFMLIDDSYNANPLSMRASLESLSCIPLRDDRLNRRFAILGDMEELGDKAEALHRELIDLLIDSGVSKLFAIGPQMRALADYIRLPLRMETHKDQKALIASVRQQVRDGDVVLVKGSNAQKLGNVVQSLATLNHNDMMTRKRMQHAVAAE